MEENDSNKRCTDINRSILQRITANPPETAVLFEYYLSYPQNGHYADAAAYEAALFSSIQKLRSAGVKNIVLIGPIPTWKDTLAHQLTRNFTQQGMAIPTRIFPSTLLATHSISPLSR